MRIFISTIFIILIFSSIVLAENDYGLKVGLQASDFKVESYEGNMVQLSKLYELGPVVLVFYRGGWCPYCNRQLKMLQSKINEFKKYNASLVAVSVDKPEMIQKTVGEHNLDFDVISDKQTDILKDYNIVYKVPDDLVAMYKEKHRIDLEASSGRDDHIIAIPAVFIIDNTGKIAFSYANEDYKVRISADQIFQELGKIDKSVKEINFYPIKHASMIIQSREMSIYVDPVGEMDAYEKYKKPDIILITDIHHDHMDLDLIKELRWEETVIVGPRAVIDKLGYGEVLNNQETKVFKNVTVNAVPMYNLTPDRLKYHEKGRGNGYVLTLNGRRIYISGDTEDIPEMRALKKIEYAFVCMNLPYTMSVDQASSAVLEFRPKVVLPYHYRGKEGMSDIQRFKQIISEKSDIEVRFLKWY